MKTLIVLAACLVGTFAYQSPEQRIFNGQRATVYDFPYQVGVEIFSTTGSSKCGGAILTNRIILTAAHCFMTGRTGRIHAGSTRWMSGTVVFFNKVVTHENFVADVQRANADIALVFLDTLLPFDGKTIAPISLGGRHIYPNEFVTVSGYGKLFDNVYTDDLYYAQERIRENNVCGGPIKDTMICSSGENWESICSGDSGGPLVVGWPTNPIHIGIVSYGQQSCQNGDPTVFTRTSSYIDWILKHQNDY